MPWPILIPQCHLPTILLTFLRRGSEAVPVPLRRAGYAPSVPTGVMRVFPSVFPRDRVRFRATITFRPSVESFRPYSDRTLEQAFDYADHFADHFARSLIHPPTHSTRRRGRWSRPSTTLTTTGRGISPAPTSRWRRCSCLGTRCCRSTWRPSSPRKISQNTYVTGDRYEDIMRLLQNPRRPSSWPERVDGALEVPASGAHHGVSEGVRSRVARATGSRGDRRPETGDRSRGR